ncbi:MAG: UDP-glucose 4-epimerase GalE [Patescibacteria group bacterium]
MAKILVTGGAGYIGSHTVHYLISRGISPTDIIVFDNLVYGHEKFLPAGVNFIKGDLLDKENIRNIFLNNEIKSVIHFAAYAYVGESMQNPGKYFENNLLAGINLLEAMKSGNCQQIVFSSTCATYGLPKNLPITETEEQKPINPYGESKLMFEKILEWYNQIYGIKSVRLRYFNAAGAGFGIGEEHNPETHLIPLVLQTALGFRKNIAIFGDDYETKDGSCVRDYIHVIDLAEAHFLSLKLMNDNNFQTDFFNLGTGKGVSVKEIITIVKEISGKDFVVLTEPRRAGDPAELVADPSKANKILGWQAKLDIRETIKNAWDWENNKN